MKRSMILWALCYALPACASLTREQMLQNMGIGPGIAINRSGTMTTIGMPTGQTIASTPRCSEHGACATFYTPLNISKYKMCCNLTANVTLLAGQQKNNIVSILQAN